MCRTACPRSPCHVIVRPLAAPSRSIVVSRKGSSVRKGEVGMQELSSRVAVVPGGVNVGILRGDGGTCVLVDTGLNDTSARKVLRAVRDELGGDVAAILTTHAHADHFGGNAWIVKRTGARVYAPALDEAWLRYPLLQPICLFAGADPPESLRGGFLLAEPSPVDEVVNPGRLVVEGMEIEVVSLAGHSPNQVGYLVDGVFFCADVVLPETVLEKYRIPYLFSVTAHLASLDRAMSVPCTVAVPGHGPRVVSLDGLIAQNRERIDDVARAILEYCADQPRTAEAILSHLLRMYGAQASDAQSFYLLHPTVFAFLAHLERFGNVRHSIEGGASLWRAC
ncbi:MAG: MBL fold metallo-hydrolase [Chloroflexota bacterium]